MKKGISLLLVFLLLFTFVPAMDLQAQEIQFEQQAAWYEENILPEDSSGMQGFEGEYAIVNHDTIINIAVQFKTPPSVALRLIQADAGISAAHFGNDSFEAQALSAHDSFASQLGQIVMPFGSGMSGMEIFGEHHKLFNGVFMSVPGRMVEVIANLPEVYAVYPDISGQVEPIKEDESFGSSSNITHNVQSRQLFNTDYIHNTLGFRGAGIRVAVLDSGVDYNHPDLMSYRDPLTGKIRGSNCIPGYPNDVIDLEGHGTHVSGTLVAMAPDIELWHFRVLNEKSAFLSASWVIDGIEKAHNANVHIINASLGLNNTWVPLSNAFNLATMDGIITVVAAGNSGPNFSTANPIALAGLPIYVANGTLGGVNQTQDTINNSSSRGPVANSLRITPDITAPGTSIRSPLPNNTYGTWNGTSMATPAVAGISALMLNAFPYAKPFEIKARLMNTARPLENIPAATNSVFTVGAGFMQPIEALLSQTYVTTLQVIELPSITSYYNTTGTTLQPAALSSFSFGGVNSMLPHNVNAIGATINNTSNVAKTYTLDYSFIRNANSAALLTLSRKSITIAPGGVGHFAGVMSFSGNVTGGTGTSGFYEGYINVRDGNKLVARLPFAAVNNGSTLPVPAYELSFNLGGALEAIDPINVRSYSFISSFVSDNHYAFISPYGDAGNFLSGPTLAGHTFGGWYLDAGFTTQVTESTVMPPQNTVLYAKWDSTSTLTSGWSINGLTAISETWIPGALYYIDNGTLLKNTWAGNDEVGIRYFGADGKMYHSGVYALNIPGWLSDSDKLELLDILLVRFDTTGVRMGSFATGEGTTGLFGFNDNLVYFINGFAYRGWILLPGGEIAYNFDDRAAIGPTELDNPWIEVNTNNPSDLPYPQGSYVGFQWLGNGQPKLMFNFENGIRQNIYATVYAPTVWYNFGSHTPVVPITNPIVGKWRIADVEGNYYIWFFSWAGNDIGGGDNDIEFFADGTVREYSWGKTGTYSTNGGQLTVNCYTTGTHYFTYIISGNTIYITDYEGYTGIYVRV